jgi:hypothetical protein
VVTATPDPTPPYDPDSSTGRGGRLGYSVWHRDAAGRTVPRIEHLYNQKRGLVIYAELQDLGVPAIPNVYWGVREDLHRWADWLGQNPCVTTIAMDLQTVDTDTDWGEVIRDVEYFSSILPRDIRCLFSGICQVIRVGRLREAWRSASLSNFAPFFTVALPKKTPYGLRPRLDHSGESSPTRIFRDTIAQYAALMSGSEPARPTRDFAARQAVSRGVGDELVPLLASPDGQLSLFRPISDKSRLRENGEGA